MAEFSKLVVTRKGQGLLAKMIVEGGKIEFTKVCTSNENHQLSQLEELVSIQNIKQTSLISKIFFTNEVEIKLEVSFSNTDLESGYYMRTLGVYALDPDEGEILYAVAIETSGNCYMPGYNGLTVSGIYIQMAITIGNAESVSFGVDHEAVTSIDNLKEQLKKHEKRIGLLERLLGIYNNIYPDVNGDGIITASDVAWVQSFASAAGAGNYTNDTTGWNAFVEENGLYGNIYPDVNGDGIITASDVAIISSFVSEVGAGNYTNDVIGWNAFMTSKNDKTVYGTGIYQIVALTQSEYNALDSPDSTTLYVVQETSGFSLFLGELALVTSGGMISIGSPLLYLGGADGNAGTITETEEA